MYNWYRESSYQLQGPLSQFLNVSYAVCSVQTEVERKVLWGGPGVGQRGQGAQFPAFAASEVTKLAA